LSCPPCHPISTLYLEQPISYGLSPSFFSLDSPSHCISTSFDLFFSVTPHVSDYIVFAVLIAIEFSSHCFPQSMPFKTPISRVCRCSSSCHDRLQQRPLWYSCPLFVLFYCVWSPSFCYLFKAESSPQYISVRERTSPSISFSFSPFYLLIPHSSSAPTQHSTPFTNPSLTDTCPAGYYPPFHTVL
jgi:hypothetical protein